MLSAIAALSFVSHLSLVCVLKFVLAITMSDTQTVTDADLDIPPPQMRSRRKSSEYLLL